VYVHRDDAHVEGLTREDFELLVNGKPQAIEYFFDRRRGSRVDGSRRIHDTAGNVRGACFC
jgi:hypothetical protein